MGGNASKATSSNIAKISQNTNVSSQLACNNSQVVNVDQDTITVGNVNCGTFKAGNISATSVATCNQYQDIAVTSKVTADQLASSLAKSGIGIFDSAIANSSNYIDVQNNLTTIMASSCINSQKINIGKRIFTAGNITGQDCEIFNDNFSQNAACIQTIKADITNSSDIKQTADSKAIAGIDLGDLIMFLILICVMIVLLMIGAIVLKSLLKPSFPGKNQAGKETLSFLIQTRNALKNAVAARASAVARRAAKVK